MTLLALEQVSKTHWLGPYEKRVLADVSLAMQSGDLFGVWGAKRSGKSTLLRVAAGLEAPDAGAVRFEGRDLASLPDAERDRLRLHRIGLVQGRGPQNVAMSMRDYVAVPLLARRSRGQARQLALAALSRVGVADCQDALWSQLSSGEQSLVSLANGISREPRLLLVDDPIAGIDDPLRQREFVDLLRTQIGRASCRER